MRAVQSPVTVTGDGHVADAKDRGGHLDFPRPLRFKPGEAGALRGRLAQGQAQQAAEAHSLYLFHRGAQLASNDAAAGTRLSEPTAVPAFRLLLHLVRKPC